MSAASLLALSAGAKADAVMVYGQGNTSCGTYIADRASQQQSYGLQFRAWAQGFLSGYVYVHGGDILKNTDWDGARLWLNNYCLEHPTEMFWFAVM